MKNQKSASAQKQKKTSGFYERSHKEATRRPAKEIALKALLLLIWTAATVIVSQLVVGYVMLLLLGREAFSQTIPLAVHSALSYILALAWLLFATPRIVVVFNSKNKQKNDEAPDDKKIMSNVVGRGDLGLKGLPTWTDIGLAPVGFIVSTLVAAGLAAIFSMFPWFDAEQTQDIGFSTFLVGIDRIVAFVILVVIAPIAEEVIFRGWLYGKIRRILSEGVSEALSITISILLVSLLFGVVHMQWNVGVNVFALSVVLCGMREITGTIYAGILTHMLKNGVAFFLLYVFGFG